MVFILYKYRGGETQYPNLNPATLGTVQLDWNSEVAAFQKKTAAKKQH